MEREHLTRLLEDPGKVAREDLGGLRDLAERHPWFSGAHLLLAAGEHATGDVQYDDTLNRAAAHLPSRAVLFDVTRSPAPAEAPLLKVVKESHSEARTPAVTEEASLEAPEGPVVHALPEDPLDAEIRRTALASSYELLLEHGAVGDMTTVPETEGPGPLTVGDIPVPPPVTDPTPEPAAPAQAPTRPLRGRMRFTDWLDTPPAARDRDDTLPHPQIAGPAEESAQPAARAAVVADPALDTGTLIDRFIQQTTPEPRPKAEFFTPQQAAKRSLDDTAGIVTETLARIYAKQGNTAKAIDAYHKLALKFPDKSAYFAALAKELEQQ